jgi:hypothetical protein
MLINITTSGLSLHRRLVMSVMSSCGCLLNLNGDEFVDLISFNGLNIGCVVVSTPLKNMKVNWDDDIPN